MFLFNYNPLYFTIREQIQQIYIWKTKQRYFSFPLKNYIFWYSLKPLVQKTAFCRSSPRSPCFLIYQSLYHYNQYGQNKTPQSYTSCTLLVSATALYRNISSWFDYSGASTLIYWTTNDHSLKVKDIIWQDLRSLSF